MKFIGNKQVCVVVSDEVDEAINVAMEKHIKDRGITIVNAKEFSPDMDEVDKIIEHFSNTERFEYPVITPIPLAPYPGEFSQNDTEKALSKKKWKEMTYEERQKHKNRFK